MDAATAHQRRWWTLGVLCVSLLVIGLDNTILNVALPTLVEDLHATASQQQWMVDAYVLVFASLLLTAGALGDKFGRRSALAAGHPLHPHQRVHRAGRTGQGHRHLGRRLRSGRGDRSGHGRLAARALLVGF